MSNKEFDVIAPPNNRPNRTMSPVAPTTLCQSIDRLDQLHPAATLGCDANRVLRPFSPYSTFS